MSDMQKFYKQKLDYAKISTETKSVEDLSREQISHVYKIGYDIKTLKLWIRGFHKSGYTY